jgi:carboxymethylenebutenolidase
MRALALLATVLVTAATGAGTPAGLPDNAPSSLPPSSDSAAARLAASPRHRELVMIAAPGGVADSVRAWVFYPEVNHKAPVVIVISEVFGLTTWLRGVGDQLAADGYIAVVPDLLTGKVSPNTPDSAPDVAISAIRTLDPAALQRTLDAVAAYGTHLPSARPAYGVIGFCWGGGVSFRTAVHHPATPLPLKAAVVYYGTPPDSLGEARAPVLGFYGGNDARVSATVPGTDSAMRMLHKVYESHIYPGAGHGFLRAQSGENGGNARATQDAWPRTLSWFRRYLGA